MATTLIKPPYELTVYDFFVHFDADDNGNEALDLQLPVVKSIGVKPSEQKQTIHASGVIYDTVSTVTEPTLSLSSVALPREFTDRADGSVKKGCAAADVAQPIKPTFACGYWCGNSDGSKTYYYHPQCKLSYSDDETHQTRTNAPVDPSVGRTVDIMPTDEGIWRVRYYTDGVTKPLTPQEFFAKQPNTLEKVMALDGAESAE